MPARRVDYAAGNRIHPEAVFSGRPGLQDSPDFGQLAGAPARITVSRCLATITTRNRCAGARNAPAKRGGEQQIYAAPLNRSDRGDVRIRKQALRLMLPARDFKLPGKSKKYAGTNPRKIARSRLRGAVCLSWRLPGPLPK